jgi:ComF family protein
MERLSMARTALDALSAFTASWPSTCTICRSWGAGPVCADCVAHFVRPKPRCARCALPLGAPAPACGACLADPPPFESTTAALEYAFPWAGLISHFKFHGAVDLAGALADRLCLAVADAGDGGGGSAGPAHRAQLVVPIPLSRERLAERGFNQAWELARRVARRLGLQARADLLHRAVDSPAQSGLSRAERLANLRGAFSAAGPAGAALVGRDVALVDDVMTTGATAAAATAALQRAGASSVQVWVLARTPAPGPEAQA